MTDDQMRRRLSAALRAQASGLNTESPVEPAPKPPSASRVAPARAAVHAKPRLSALAVLALAVLLGAMAGALAGMISAW
ncbi:MAG: hypothetical protein M3460_19645 [Actinomycetota bacterium]|nr:hypothetical protein [Actinomycetota bacterium]